MPTPEEQTRQKIDQPVKPAGWQIQDRKELDLGGAAEMVRRKLLHEGERWRETSD